MMIRIYQRKPRKEKWTLIARHTFSSPDGCRFYMHTLCPILERKADDTLREFKLKFGRTIQTISPMYPYTRKRRLTVDQALAGTPPEPVPQEMIDRFGGRS